MDRKLFRITVVGVLAFCLSFNYSLAAAGQASGEKEYNECLARAQIQYAEHIGTSATAGGVTGAIVGSTVGGAGAIPGSVTGFIVGLVGGSITGIPAFANAVEACKEYLQ